MVPVSSYHTQHHVKIPVWQDSRAKEQGKEHRCVIAYLHALPPQLGRHKPTNLLRPPVPPLLHNRTRDIFLRRLEPALLLDELVPRLVVLRLDLAVDHLRIELVRRAGRRVRRRGVLDDGAGERAAGGAGGQRLRRGEGLRVGQRGGGLGACAFEA